MKILAIRFARLGDVVLLLPALSSLKRAFPEARLTLLTGHRCTPIAQLCPAVDETFAVDRVAMRDGSRSAALRDITRLVREVRRRRFDLVIDFHSFRETNLLTWLSGAPVRIGMKRDKAPYLNFCFNRPPVIEDKSLHVAAMFEKAVETIIPLAEAVNKFSRATPLLQGGKWLCIPDELKHWACQIGHNASRVAFYIDAPVTERIWPPERFAAVADFAIERWAALPLVIASQQRLHQRPLEVVMPGAREARRTAAAAVVVRGDGAGQVGLHAASLGVHQADVVAAAGIAEIAGADEERRGADVVAGGHGAGRVEERHVVGPTLPAAVLIGDAAARERPREDLGPRRVQAGVDVLDER